MKATGVPLEAIGLENYTVKSCRKITGWREAGGTSNDDGCSPGLRATTMLVSEAASIIGIRAADLTRLIHSNKCPAVQVDATINGRGRKSYRRQLWRVPVAWVETEKERVAAARKAKEAKRKGDSNHEHE